MKCGGLRIWVLLYISKVCFCFQPKISKIGWDVPIIITKVNKRWVTFLRHSVVSYLCCLLNFHVIFINLVRSKLTQAYYYHVVAVSEKDVFCIYFTIAFTSNFVIFLSSICDDFEFWTAAQVLLVNSLIWYKVNRPNHKPRPNLNDCSLTLMMLKRKLTNLSKITNRRLMIFVLYKPGPI